MVGRLVADVWPGAVLVDEPRPMMGGFWAPMLRVEVAGQPAGVPPSLVLRFPPDAAMGAKEMAVQDRLARADYPTPVVRARGTDHTGRTFALMDFVDGRPLLAGLAGGAALRRAPNLVTTLPAIMADALSRLHQVDPEPVTAAVHDDAPSVAWLVDDLLVHLAIGADELRRPDVAAAVADLADRRPPERRRVVCHGDFHPLNILAGVDGVITVVDWTGAVLAPPEFDLAFTTLLLANPPLDAGAVLGRIVDGVGRLILRRFLEAYRRSTPSPDLRDLDWYRALHGARILIEHASLEARLGRAAADHPFARLVTPAATALGGLTGLTIARTD